jgi:HSP20 family protein
MYDSFRYAGDVFPELARLQRHLDEVFQAAVPTNIRAPARGSFPAVNLGISDETIEVLAFAPGVEAKDLQITVDRGVLTIAGERRTAPAKRSDAETVHAQERYSGSFRRVISLPEDADPTKVDAKLRDGVLHVTVHKRESSKPRQITVN